MNFNFTLNNKDKIKNISKDHLQSVNTTINNMIKELNSNDVEYRRQAKLLEEKYINNKNNIINRYKNIYNNTNSNYINKINNI